MSKISSGTALQRVPPADDGVQVNFCKKPGCPNFGVPAIESGRRKDGYKITSAGAHYRLLFCQHCHESPPFKSNAGIAEELKRLSASLAPPVAPSCPNSSCSNHGASVSEHPEAYQGFGKTASGSRRLRCKQCRHTFAIGGPTIRQREPHKNKIIFKLLVNKTPIKRICEVAEVHPQTVYDKLDFLYRQACAFAGSRERDLPGMPIERLDVSVDRQDYLVNWTRRADKRNVRLSAVGSADNRTGYVFGMHMNFDPSLNSAAVEKEALRLHDYDRPYAFRRFARVWLARDYEESLKRCRRSGAASGKLTDDIEAAYAESGEREDVEAFERIDASLKLPIKGIQVHAEYTLYAHFLLLARLFQNVGKVRFFIDQDSGMRAACLSAFHREILERRADAFYVRIASDKTVDEKRKLLKASRERFQEAKARRPKLTDRELRLLLIREQMAAMAERGRWKDKWLIHPSPDMSEPEKAVCYLTDYGDYDPDHLAALYDRASLHGVDRFFMQVRRRLSLLERPIVTASKARRTWHGYAPYNPEVAMKLLELFRVHYNYLQPGKDGESPAQRLELAKGKVRMEDVIYFS